MAYLLSQLLAASTRTQAERVAVIYANQQLTYQALDSLSNQVAQTLQQMGVARGDRVGLYLDKSVEAVAAIFGVLKAGAAYVPLDPGAPVKRVAYIVDNCQMKALISTAQKVVALQPHLALTSASSGVILVDEEGATIEAALFPQVVAWSQLQHFPIDPPLDPHLIEDDLAYILYTSGSTGAPKGVMISHRAALTFVEWACQTFDVQPSDRVSNHAPFHFDLSIFDIFATIQAGGTIVLVPPALSVFPLSLAKFIAEQRISIWYSVPSALTRLVLSGNLATFDFSHLRTVLFAGEVFPVKYLRQLMERIPHARYHNLYGPTETNVCTWYSVPPLAPERSEPISIGKGCANSEILLLDEQQQRVSPGAVGELCVRGPGLMKGYWGLPEKSAQALTAFSQHPGVGSELIYHTGDLAQEEADGNYTYLGRRDNQIKSRGYRIELGEIETTLYSHPAVEEAAVIPIADDEIGNRIKAFIVTHTDAPLTSAALEAFCAERLPKYMLPHQIEFRAVLPKTSTGKVDKRQLHAI